MREPFKLAKPVDGVWQLMHAAPRGSDKLVSLNIFSPKSCNAVRTGGGAGGGGGGGVADSASKADSAKHVRTASVAAMVNVFVVFTLVLLVKV
jgi:hypothetical protein